MDIRYWALGLMLAFGSAVYADDDRGWYAGAGIGQYSVDTSGADESDTAMRFFGGWKMNKHWSFEGGYTFFSEVSSSFTDPLLGTTDVDVDVTSLDFYVRPTWPLNDQWELYGIAGFSRIEADVKVSGLINFSGSSSDTELMYGFGGTYKFADRWSVRGDWVNYDGDLDLSMFSIAAIYNFH